jgi:hypothetical protein
MDTALLKNCILKILQHFQIRQQEFKEWLITAAPTKTWSTEVFHMLF